MKKIIIIFLVMFIITSCNRNAIEVQDEKSDTLTGSGIVYSEQFYIKDSINLRISYVSTPRTVNPFELWVLKSKTDSITLPNFRSDNETIFKTITIKKDTGFYYLKVSSSGLFTVIKN